MSNGKRSLGTTAFGIIFILIGIVLFYQAIGYFTSKQAQYPRHYAAFRESIDKFITMVQKGDIDLKVEHAKSEDGKPKIRIKAEGEGSEELKSQLAAYNDRGLTNKYLPISLKLLVIWRFIAGALFIACGILILMLFPHARIGAISLAFVNLIYFPLLGFNVYLSVKDILTFFDDILSILSRNASGFNVPEVFITGFKAMFVGPIVVYHLAGFLINVVFAIIVCHYFRNTEVKTQFE